MNENNQIKRLLTSRQSLIEVVLIAALIGVGINFISSSLLELYGLKIGYIHFLYIGFFLLFFSAIYFAYRIYRRKKVERQYEGFIVFDKSDKLPFSCEGYEYSEELRRNFEAAFSENKAIKHIWESDKSERSDRNKIIKEATEYYIIDTLSTHLTDYFNSRDIEKDQIEELSRKHIPHVLLENRFLELFSKPMEQREQFIRDIENDKKKETPGKVVMSYGKSGALFKNFDLVLPKKSKVLKTNNSLTIVTPRFSLTFNVNYNGFGSVLPYGYIKHFLGFKSYTDQSTDQINVNVVIEYNWTSFFINSGWDYYEWLDLFLEKMQCEFSKDYYFESINWETIFTQTKIIEGFFNK